MSWNDLYGVNTVTGKAIDIPTLIGPGVDHDRRGRTGVPNGATLTIMVNAADALRLTGAPRTRRGGVSDGISFHIARHVPGDASPTITNQFVGQKAGSVMCYENTLFNDALAGHTDAIVSNIVVCRSVAPYTRCRAGYRQLAQNGPYTIVVSSGDGYDGIPGNIVFPFTPTKLIFYRRRTPAEPPHLRGLPSRPEPLNTDASRTACIM